MQACETTFTNTQSLEVTLKHELNFNIFAYVDQNGRQSAFVKLVIQHTQPHLNTVDLKNFDEFILKVFAGYAEFELSYHNDLHGLDVMQMTSAILNAGLKNFSQIDEIDAVAVLIGAVCHDFKHDGFNNQYHTQIKTDRFMLFGEVGTQEQFHFAESWKLVESLQLLFNLTQHDQKRFKERMMGVIFSTDMSRHMNDLKEIKQLLEVDIDKEETGLKALIQSEATRNITQQKLMNLAVHTSDISFLCRDQSVSQKWVDLLFQEFFHQGDKQKLQGLQLSMMCDRDPQLTYIPKTQPGFIAFATMPLIKCITQIVPTFQEALDRLQKNKEEWESNPSKWDPISVYTSQTNGKMPLDQKLWTLTSAM